MILKSIELADFKGIKSAKYEFNGKSAVVSGSNGLGKTTIADAFYYVFADRDYQLNNKPEIFPIDIEEAEPKVTIVVDINGVENTISKWQKRSVKDKNGVREVATKNEYSINEVPLSATKFNATLIEKGIDISDILQFSHPEVFTAQMTSKKDRDVMRATLFKMANSKSDLELCEFDDELSDLHELLQKYSLEEIKSLHTTRRKKAAEQVESIPDQILGMEKTKVDYDGSALELEKNRINEEIKNAEARKVVGNDVKIKELESKLFQLQFEINDCQRKLNEDIHTKRRKLESDISEKERLIRENDFAVNQKNSIITTLKNDIAKTDKENKQAGDEYRKLQATSLDENSKVCTLCGQPLPEDKLIEVMTNFENQKKKQLADLINLGNTQKAIIKKKSEEIENLDKEVKNLISADEKLKSELQELENNLNEVPENANYFESDEWNVLNRAKDNLEKELAELRESDSKVDNFTIEREISNLQSELLEIEGKITLIVHNTTIDEQIEELRLEQKKAAQEKANAEYILNQIDILSKKKNECLTDEINSHFSLVKFMFFDYQKNGGYIECCQPVVDGKKLGESMNTGLEMLAKIDIINGLQKFFDYHVPVFLDQAEKLDTKSISAVLKDNSDLQIIALKVADSDLKVEVL